MFQEKADAELIALFVAAQDEAAFAEIVSRHGNMVFRVCRDILSDSYEAEDACQEVFALLAKKAKLLKTRSKAAAWLFGVARNVSLQMLRSRMGRFNVETLDDLEGMTANEDDLELIGADIADSLYDAIAGLSDVQQQAVLLRYLKGYSERDSAQLAGCTENTLAKRASNGIAQLRTILVKRNATRNRKKERIMNKNKTNRVITALGGLPHAGPFINRIIDSPADLNRLYATGHSSNSIYVSSNGGATWSIAHLPFSGSSALGVSPVNADHLLVARGNCGFEKGNIILSQSTDGGVTWSDLTSKEVKSGVRRIQFSPVNTNIAYLQLWSQIFRLDLRSKALTEIFDDHARNMELDPANADRLYLTTPKAFMTTENGGQTWVTKAFPMGMDYAMSLAVDASNNSRLVVALKQMFLSEDGGDSWKDLGQVGKSYIDYIAFDPVNPQRIYAHDRLTGLTISNNGGRTWNPTSDTVLNTYARQIQCLHASTLVPGLVIVTTDDGIYRSTDGGQSFAAVHDGLQQHSCIVGLAVDPSNPKHVIARTSSRVYYSDDAGQTWTQSGGVTSCVDWTQQSLAIDANGQNCYVGNMEGDFLRSTNRGISFEPISKSPKLATIMADTTKPGKLFGTWPGIHVSEDGGNSWYAIKGVPNWIWTLAISPVDPKVVYASGAKTVYHMVTDEKTGNPEFIAATTPPEAIPETIVRQIFPDPRNPKRALAANTGTNNGIWQTEDGGVTWSLLIAGFFSHPYLRAAEPDVIYVSTNNGFYVWRDGQLTPIDENIKVNAYAEIPDGLLLGTETGIYKLTWQ